MVSKTGRAHPAASGEQERSSSRAPKKTWSATRFFAAGGLRTTRPEDDSPHPTRASASSSGETATPHPTERHETTSQEGPWEQAADRPTPASRHYGAQSHLSRHGHKATNPDRARSRQHPRRIPIDRVRTRADRPAPHTPARSTPRCSEARLRVAARRPARTWTRDELAFGARSAADGTRVCRG